MKTKEELYALKKEIATMNSRLMELSEEELTQATGGSWYHAPDAPECPYCGSHDTYTVGFFLMWDGMCRKCHSHFTESTSSRIK